METNYLRAELVNCKDIEDFNNLLEHILEKLKELEEENIYLDRKLKDKEIQELKKVKKKIETIWFFDSFALIMILIGTTIASVIGSIFLFKFSALFGVLFLAVSLGKRISF